jgi:hypothetical protein
MSGDEVEELAAILVSREYPESIRIRPSQGDGGLDLLLPESDGTFHVMQVKKFSQNLAASEKRQISKSLRRLGVFAAEKAFTVSAWDVVLPLDPTNENLTWLAGLPRVQEVKPGWKGLHYLDGLAAKFPDVVDYYANDGRQRLQDAMADLTALLYQHTPGTAGAPLGAAEAEPVLAALSRRINDHDPHYFYDLHVTAQPLDLDTFDDRGAAMIYQSGGPGAWVTVEVHPRFSDAPNVRPIQGTLNIRVPAGTELEKAVREFGDYGADLRLTGEHFDVTLDAPGGLVPAPTMQPAQLRIIHNPTPGAQPQEARWTITAPDGKVVAETLVVIESGGTGLTGVGGRLNGRDVGGVFDVIMFLNTDTRDARINLTPNDLEGKRLEDVRAGAQFLAHFAAPNRLTMSNPYRRPADYGSLDITQSADPSATIIHAIIEALVEIQQAAGRTIRVPKLLEPPAESFEPLIAAAQLLRGDEIPAAFGEITWTVPEEYPNGLSAAELTSLFSGAMALRSPLTVTITGVEINLGTLQFSTPTVQLRDLPTDSLLPGTQVVIAPVDGTPGTIRLLRLES